MKYLMNLNLILVLILSASVLLASGCGGGGGSGSSDDETAPVSGGDTGTTVVSRGIITGFGSVYVNGVRYHTNSGTHFSIDDDDGVESELKVGMIVTVKGTSTDDSNGSADSITYDNELKGPVTSITEVVDPPSKTLTILGQAVLVTADTTIDDDGGLTYATIAVDDVLEVSGYPTDTGLTATHIELQTGLFEIELKGHIDGLSLTPNSFTIGGFAVSYDIGTVILDDIATLADDLFVEVKGQLDVPITGTTLIARKIEGEDEGFDDDVDEAEIKGVITDYDNEKKTFKLLGQKIDASGARLEPVSLVLANDITVEAEGRMFEGVLIAHKVEQKGNKIKIQAELSAVDEDAGTVSFRFNGTDVSIRVHAGTEIEDDDTGDDLTLSDLKAGHFVELEAFGEGPGVINAVEIERMVPDASDEIRIVAPLEDSNFDGTDGSVRLLGITFDLSTVTQFKRLDTVIPEGDFYRDLVIGGFVKIKDNDRNLTFDRAEIEG